ncbi:hypothetical protein EV189_3549 [Motilibacter rhizosphaerae]|uniref:ATP-grasp domain-containing protein n=1 Tax=Motilibacter rhizosphaerae TaxID=598652 RepID=A0A4Q7NAX7_9ACTN|nr:hypothetical protein [Motilibacter rhizosphaerae]RZS80069.1 hypothetical protein EV189_3549 [Motilibacter rhizosphaerae]
MRWIWSEQVRDSRLPGRWEQRLESRAGWRLRRWASPVQPLAWLATGTPPSRQGYAPGPLTALRTAHHRRLDRAYRLCLLEGPSTGPRFSPVTAYWVNERSRVVRAEVDGDPAEADLVWVHAQDPLAPAARAWVERALERVRPGTPVVNPPSAYDSYHLPGTFERLRAAGVRVPDPEPRVGELAVVKGPGQASRKELRRFDGVLGPGERAFAYVDARSRDGLHRRWRAFSWLGTVHAGDVLASRHWEVGLGSLEVHEPVFALSADDEEQVRRVGEVLGLGWFCVDLVRGPDGLAVVTDVNVYPTPVIAAFVDRRLDCRGRWHFLDTPARMGLAEPQGRFWARFDDAVVRLLRPRLSPAPPLPTGAPCPSSP